MIHLGGGKGDRKTSLAWTPACQGLPRSGTARMGRDNGNGAFGSKVWFQLDLRAEQDPVRGKGKHARKRISVGCDPEAGRQGLLGTWMGRERDVTRTGCICNREATPVQVTSQARCGLMLSKGSCWANISTCLPASCNPQSLSV